MISFSSFFFPRKFWNAIHACLLLLKTGPMRMHCEALINTWWHAYTNVSIHKYAICTHTHTPPHKHTLKSIYDKKYALVVLYQKANLYLRKWKLLALTSPILHASSIPMGWNYSKSVSIIIIIIIIYIHIYIYIYIYIILRYCKEKKSKKKTEMEKTIQSGIINAQQGFYKSSVGR